MLKEIPLGQWILLLISMVIFLGPGLGILSVVRKQAYTSIVSNIMVSLVLSVGFWAIVLAWLKIFSLRILYVHTVYFISILGWLVSLLRGFIKTVNLSKAIQQEALIWIGVSISIIINLYSLRRMVAGLGSDSYHHTLITHLFIWNHALPSNYFPAVEDILTFNYHYGFHASAAVLSLLSGWQPRLLVLTLGPVLVGISGLSIAHFIYEQTRKPIAAIVAAYIPTLVCVFPTAMFLWGRYPQTLGLIILPVILNQIHDMPENNKSEVFLLGFTLATLLFVHYRVTYMALIATFTWIIWILIRNQNKAITSTFRSLSPYFYAGGIAVVIVSPWLIRVWLNLHTGYADPLTSTGSSFYSLTRLGSKVLNYPTNSWLLILGGVGLLSGLLRKENTAVWVAIWFALLLAPAQLTGPFADTITVLTSAYAPLAIILGLFASYTLDKVRVSPGLGRAFIGVTILTLGILGGLHLREFLNDPDSAYVSPEDLKAAEWIKNNIPKNARFMVNLYRFDFSSNFIIGIDAGGWLPIIAERHVITYPMTTQVERFKEPDALQKLVSLYKMQDRLASPESIDLMHMYGITHVYIGEKGGKIDPQTLLESPYYQLLYQDGKTFVFALR